MRAPPHLRREAHRRARAPRSRARSPARASSPAPSSAAYSASMLVDGRAGRGDDEVAALDPRALGRAAVLDRADEHAVALGQPDRRAQPARHAWRRDGDAEPPGRAALAAREPVDALGGDRHGEDQAAVHADGVEAEQPALGVDERARPTSRAAAARCARASRRSGARAGRGRPRGAEDTKPSVTRSPRPPGLASASTGVPMPGGSPCAHCERLDVAGVDRRARRGRRRGRRPRRARSRGGRRRR